jgi:serine/threonine-protein kinase
MLHSLLCSLLTWGLVRADYQCGVLCGRGGGWFLPIGQSAVCNYCVQCTSGSFCTTSSGSGGGQYNYGVSGACPAGTYSGVGASSCTGCPAGTFSANTSSSSCLTCPPATYSIARNTSCLYTSSTCPPGTYANSTAACERCPAGSYNSFEGGASSSACQSCAAGAFQPSTGQTSCSFCPAGTYSAGGAASCSTCTAGSYCPGASNAVACAGGTFNPNSGSVSEKACALCPPGSFSSAEGQAYCLGVCPAGKFNPIEGSTSGSSCRDCPPGSFCFEGAASPYPCSAGYYGDSAGLTTSVCSSACSAPPGSGCPAGSTSPLNATQLCAPGFYCPGGSPAPAIPCSFQGNCPTAGLSAERACAWSVDTLAGSAAGAIDGLGTAAFFNSPRSVATDASGVVFVADSKNNRIRAVSSSGLVSTLAGNGSSTWADGTGTSASFFEPSGVATYSASGILYVADTGNHRIRLLLLTGVTSTFAGCGRAARADGQGTHACFSSPQGLAVDSAGVVYVADYGNHLIRKITPLGAVTKLAGTGSSEPFSNGGGTATFQNPSGVALDGSGNIYVGDSKNNRIRRILPNGTVFTFAGSGRSEWADGTGALASFWSPSHLSFAANGDLFVTDTMNQRVRKIDPLGKVSTIAGSTASFLDGFGTAALFNSPVGVTVSPTGILSSGDTINHRIRSLACRPCPASYFCPSSTGEPKLCPLGSACPVGSTSPLQCPAGTVASSQGAVSCQKCPRGSYSSLPGSISCTGLCPTGTYGNASGSTSASSGCRQCPTGTYNEDEGLGSVTGCSPCPAGSASSTSGASSSTQCSPCVAGTFASLAGSSACTPSPPGSYSAPASSSPTLCPLGTYSGITGAVAESQCTACPSGKTTASTGATQDTQCLALPFTCPAGKQPRLAVAASLADCASLICPPPLRPSAFASFGSDSVALTQSLSCLGCAGGTLGTVPACTPCDSTSFCPGFTSRPLYNFSGGASASGASRAFAQGSGAPTTPFAACPALDAISNSATTSNNLASAATSTAFFGVSMPRTSAQPLLAWFVIFFSLFLFATFVACSRTAENATGCSALPLRALKAVDLFSMKHRVEDKRSPINEATPLGGLFTLMGFTTLITYAAYMVVMWLQDNTLAQKSLATMGPSVWGELAALPWVAPTSFSSLGSLALRLTIDGNPGACAVPLSMTTTGLDSGSFVRTSTPDCGGTGISQHTLTCPGCRLTSDTALSLVFDYSCQSMLLEALGSSPAYPGPLSISTISAPTARTASPKPGALLTSLTWQLTPVLSVLWDNTTAFDSAIGWYLADSKLILAPFLTPSALNGSLSVIPTASFVTVTFALSLSSTYSSTLLTQRVPITQLLANIVGLSGLLAFFGMAFGSFEGFCSRKRGAVGGANNHLPLSSSAGISAQGGYPVEANAVLAVENPLWVGSPVARETENAECTLAGELKTLRKLVEAGAQREAALWREMEAIKKEILPQEAPAAAAAAAVMWRRRSDSSGYAWFTSSAGDAAWELPPGASLQPAEDARGDASAS